MDIAVLVRKFVDTYKIAQPIYGNHAPIYGNTTPICKPDGKFYDEIYKLFSYIQKQKPDILEKIDRVVSHNYVFLIPDIISYLENEIPEEYLCASRTVMFILNVIDKIRRHD